MTKISLEKSPFPAENGSDRERHRYVQNSCGRLKSIDVIKGLLLLMMLVYHNAPKQVFPDLAIIQAALPVISYAFLFMCGLVAAIHYGSQSRRQAAVVRRQLWWRSLKLIRLFLLVNIFVYAAGLSEVGTLKHLCSWSGIVDNLILSVDGEMFASEILLYIAIFLLCVSLVLMLRPVLGACVGLLLLASIIPGCTIIYLGSGAAGLAIGLMAGQTRLNRVVGFCRHYGFVFPVLLVGYLLIGTYCLSFGFRSLTILSNAMELFLWSGICLWVCGLGSRRKLEAWMAWLGQYTLAGYLFQLPAIRGVQILTRSIPWDSSALFVANLLFSSVLTITFLVVVDRFRHRYVRLNHLYKMIF